MSEQDGSARSDEDGLTREEREWMDQVPDRVEPPPTLRRQVVERLVAAGELEHAGGHPRLARRATGVRTWTVAAGLVLAFLSGGLAGRWSVSGGAAIPTGAGDTVGGGAVPDALTTGEDRFILLLYEDDAYRTPGRSFEQLAAEYKAWSRRLAEGGHLVLAEKLADGGRVVSATMPRGAEGQPISPTTASRPAGDFGKLAGFFIVRAASYDAALELANASPHTANGGRIVIRRIDPE